MRVVCGEAKVIPAGMAHALARYRYRVFVERLGWTLQTAGQVELDEFDRPDTVHVVALDESDDIVGCCRLLPTTAPYLIAQVFPELLGGERPPSSPRIWELSRFAGVDLKHSSPVRADRFTSVAARALIDAALSYAASRGVDRLISGSPLGVPRLLRQLGIAACLAGPPVMIDMRPMVAVFIEVPAQAPSLSDPTKLIHTARLQA